MTSWRYYYDHHHHHREFEFRFFHTESGTVRYGTVPHVVTRRSFCTGCGAVRRRAAPDMV